MQKYINYPLKIGFNIAQWYYSANEAQITTHDLKWPAKALDHPMPGHAIADQDVLKHRVNPMQEKWEPYMREYYKRFPEDKLSYGFVNNVKMERYWVHPMYKFCDRVVEIQKETGKGFKGAFNQAEKERYQYDERMYVERELAKVEAEKVFGNRSLSEEAKKFQMNMPYLNSYAQWFYVQKQTRMKKLELFCSLNRTETTPARLTMEDLAPLSYADVMDYIRTHPEDREYFDASVYWGDTNISALHKRMVGKMPEDEDMMDAKDGKPFEPFKFNELRDNKSVPLEKQEEMTQEITQQAEDIKKHFQSSLADWTAHYKIPHQERDAMWGAMKEDPGFDPTAPLTRNHSTSALLQERGDYRGRLDRQVKNMDVNKLLKFRTDPTRKTYMDKPEHYRHEGYRNGADKDL